MKCIIVRKRSFVLVINIILAVLVVSALSLSDAVKSVMADIHRNPITSFETDENKICLSVNVYENTDIDRLLKAFGKAKATFFVSEAFQELYGEKVTEIAARGHTVGILEDGMKNKTRNEIYDRLAQRIERLSFLTGVNADLVRFNNNSFDTNCVDAVFSLGLFAVQWATDDTAEYFSEGDIILVTGESDVENFIKKTAVDGFEAVTVDELILRHNYKIDLSGMQSPR